MVAAVSSKLVSLDSPDVHSASAEYAGRFSGSVGAWMLRVQWAALKQLITVPAPGPVLDVGGGHGQLALPLARVGYNVTVLASTAAAAEMLHRSMAGAPQEEQSRITIRYGSLDTRESVVRGEFPLVVSFRILSHMEDWRSFLAGLSQSCSRQVIVDYPSRRSVNYLADAMFAMKKRVEGNTRSFTVFNDREVSELLVANDLRQVSSVRQFSVPMAIHRALHSSGMSATLEGLASSLGLTRLVGSPVVLSGVKR